MSVIRFKPLPGRPLLALPAYATQGAAGLDLLSAETTTIPPSAWVSVGTGLGVQLEPGFEGQVRPRSGLAAKHGVTVLNAPGTIDADYRGELRILLVNHGREPYEIVVGDRVAQLVVARVEQPEVHLVTSLDQTDRGDGGFGHTGR